MDLAFLIRSIPAKKKIPPPMYRYRNGNHELKKVGIANFLKSLGANYG
jgi:hypothetical protein